MTNPSIYSLNGRVPLKQAVPFGLQHVLAMFVANITPIIILANVVGIDASLSASLVQNCMVIAGLGTLVQLYPVWRIGSRLPIVMGISFTFLSLAIAIASAQGMGTLMGAIIVGGLLEGCLGLCSKVWTRFITPVVAATVVTAIGFSLLPIGANSFGGGQGAVIMVVGGLFPTVGILLTTIPQAVLGGCTLMMFGSILFAGFGMLAKSGFSQRNMVIVSVSLSVGLGFTQASSLFDIFPQMVRTIFADNCVAVVFLLALLLELTLPKKAE